VRSEAELSAFLPEHDKASFRPGQLNRSVHNKSEEVIQNRVELSARKAANSIPTSRNPCKDKLISELGSETLSSDWSKSPV
jgi:hypothetical protein